MEKWYYKKGDSNAGPFTAAELQQLLETKLIPASVSVKAEELGEWQDIRTLNLFNGSIGLPPNVASRHARPWCRYWARIIDIQLSSIFLAIPLGILIALFAPDLNIPNLLLGIILLLLYVFIEPVLLATIGTTVGKALFRIRLRRADGKKLSYGDALKRSFGVFIKGLAAGLPLISMATLITSYQRLSNQGITSWDEGCSLLVSHRKLGIIRLIFIVPITIGTLLLSIWGCI